MRILPSFIALASLHACAPPCETLALDTMVPAMEACDLESPAWMSEGPWDCDADYDYDCGAACWDAATCEDIEVWLSDQAPAGALDTCERGCWGQ